MAVFLGIAWAVNVGGIVTPGGSPTNLIAVGLAERADCRIGYLQWVAASLPFAAIMLVMMFLVLWAFLPREETQQQISRERIRDELRQMGPLSRGEIFALLALLVAVTLWVLGYVRIVPMFLRGGILAIIGSILLSFIGYPLVNWMLPWTSN